MLPVALPVSPRVKSSVETPVTASLKLAVKFTVVLLAEAPLAGAMLTTVGTTLSTVALLVSARVVLPMLLVAVMLTLRLLAVMPAASIWLALQMPALLVAATAAPPPNWLKSTVTPVMPLLLSPLVVLFQLAVTVSPSRKAPPLPVAPAMLILASVTFGGRPPVTLLVTDRPLKLAGMLFALSDSLLLLTYSRVTVMPASIAGLTVSDNCEPA